MLLHAPDWTRTSASSLGERRSFHLSYGRIHSKTNGGGQSQLAYNDEDPAKTGSLLTIALPLPPDYVSLLVAIGGPSRESSRAP